MSSTIGFSVQRKRDVAFIKAWHPAEPAHGSNVLERFCSSSGDGTKGHTLSVESCPKCLATACFDDSPHAMTGFGGIAVHADGTELSMPQAERSVRIDRDAKLMGRHSRPSFWAS